MRSEGNIYIYRRHKRTVDLFFAKKFYVNQLTFCPSGNPGSQTARDSSLTSKSWTCPMLSPTLSKPSCSMPNVGTSVFKSSPKTFPKPRRNCINIKQSETACPGRMSPGIREKSGRGWTERECKNRILCFLTHLRFIQKRQI